MKDHKRENASFEIVFLLAMLSVSAVLYSDASRMRLWQQKFTVELLFHIAIILCCIRVATLLYFRLTGRRAIDLLRFDDIDRRTAVFGVALVALVALIPTLGMFAALALFAIPMMWFLGVRPWFLPIVISFGVIALFWVILVPTLGVRLPRGLLF